MPTYKPLTYDDRKIIEKMCKFGASSQEIADTIDKTYSTIYRELRRCPLGKYSADEAQMDADSKKRDRYSYQYAPIECSQTTKDIFYARCNKWK